MFKRKTKERDAEKLSKYNKIKNEFRAQIDKNTSLSLVETETKAIFIIKKNLQDYKIYVSSSEAPVQNYLKNTEFEIQPYDQIIGERAILDKEVFPLNDKIKKVFGDVLNLRLRKIRLCFGREEDYITVDERDLKKYKVDPSIQGLKEFILSNQRSVLGFAVRRFRPKAGNMIFLKCGYEEQYFDEIKSIDVKIIASLQQRGFYMQKHSQPYGLQMYIILNVRKKRNMISDRVIKLLKELDIPLEVLILQRSSSIQNWTAIECELNTGNLRNYLQSQFKELSHSDVRNIARFCEKYNLNFDVAQMMGEMLNKMNIMRTQRGKRENVLESEEIAAAGKIAAAHYGIKGFKLSKELNKEYLERIESELNNYY